ncbi:MAG: WYL domain-containing protein [Ruminococcus sp.]|nr:WYL domain-containing protein [Ruminococcus sp.]
MAVFKELIGSLEKTRTYFRDFFVYGFKTDEDFSQKSKRTYEDEKRRAELLLKDHITSVKAPDSSFKKIVCVPVDSGDILENPFYGIYYAKSFTDNDIKLHFAILDILSGGESLDTKEITERISLKYSASLWGCNFIEESTVRIKLNEYVGEGLLISEKRNKKVYYKLTPHTVDGLFERFEGLDDAVKFFSETQEFGVVGNFLLKDASLKNDLFYMKHSYIIHTLEDEVLAYIAEAVEKKSAVTFESTGNRKTSCGEPKTMKHTAIPFMILVSAQTGRRYLLWYDEKLKRFTTSRLDQMKKVKLEKDVADSYDELAAAARKSLEKVFGVNFGLQETTTARPVRIKIFADEKTESYIIERIMREKRCGTVERTAENEYTLTFDILNSYELLGWLKTFTGRIISFEGGNQGAADKLCDDIRRMYEMYGGNAE